MTQIERPDAATDMPPQRRGTSVAMIVLIALALRLAVIFIGHTYRINPRNDFQNFGFEMGRVARSLATGQGFSSPFDIPTGPTALVPPLFPALLAGIFKLFGIYTRAAAIVILALDSLFSALVCVVVYRIGQRLFDERVARWSAWSWALFPYAIYWPVRMVWETSLSALLLSLAVLQTLRCDIDERPRQWALMGVLWGVMALTNPALLAIAPVTVIWLLLEGSLRPRQLALAVVIAAAMIAPWTARNYSVFHRFILVRDNFWLEVHVNNNPKSDGFWTRSEHPGNDARAMAEFQRLGETGYMSAMREQAQPFIRQHPALFLGWTFKRVFFFWLGEPKEEVVGTWEVDFAKHVGFGLWTLAALAGLWLMSRRDTYGAGLVAGILALYPIAYYVTRASPRYRHPIEPLLVLLTLYAIAALKRDKAGRQAGAPTATPRGDENPATR